MAIAGIVGASGDIVSGSGFKVIKRGEGKFTLVFNYDFWSLPAVVCTVEDNDYSTLSTVIVRTLQKGQADIDTGDYYGQNSNRSFHFLATDTGRDST